MVKGMIFLLNLNPTRLNIYESWSFNMVLRTLFGLFDSPCAGIGLYVKEGIKRHVIHIKLKSYKLELLEKLVV